MGRTRRGVRQVGRVEQKGEGGTVKCSGEGVTPDEGKSHTSKERAKSTEHRLIKNGGLQLR